MKLQDISEYEIIDLGIVESEVYDLEIENNHNFFANDLLVHNSLYITFDPLVKNVFKDESDKKKIVNFLDIVAKEKMQPLIKDLVAEFCEYLNTYENHLVMKREVIADRAVFTGKKRYMLNVHNKEGIAYEIPQLKIMGIESVRSSTPECCRKTIKECVRLILTSDNDTVIQYIEDFKKIFMELPIEEISRNSSVQDVASYYDVNNIYRKGTPMHVKGVLIFNHYVKKMKLERKYPLIQNGTKIKFASLVKHNPFHDTVIGFETQLPKEFKLEKYIDRDEQFTKCFLQPVELILGAIKWKSKNESSLSDFF